MSVGIGRDQDVVNTGAHSYHPSPGTQINDLGVHAHCSAQQQATAAILDCTACWVLLSFYSHSSPPTADRTSCVHRGEGRPFVQPPVSVNFYCRPPGFMISLISRLACQPCSGRRGRQVGGGGSYNERSLGRLVSH